MIKVFLAEDESVVREALRDTIPWQQYGFTFVGEAGDGEMALPRIRKLQPDVLITDIRMPFMDGLELCHVVHQEFPNMKIIIISGFDEFEYARRAIAEGVDQYLSKPVTRRAMQRALEEVKKKIDSEQEQENYVRKFEEERQEHGQFYRRVFFEQVFSGKLQTVDIYSEAQKLSLELTGPCYNLILYSVSGCAEQAGAQREVDPGEYCQDELMHYFLRYHQYIYFRWSINVCGVLVRGERTEVSEYTARGMDKIAQSCSRGGEKLEWYVACGEMVERLSMLKNCYERANHIFACRFLSPDIHVLTGEYADSLAPGSAKTHLENVDVRMVDPEIIKGFLRKGQKEETEEFVRGYLDSLTDALRSRMFRDYLLLNIRFAAISVVEELGGTRQEAFEGRQEAIYDPSGSLGELKENIRQLLEQVIDYRDMLEGMKGSRILTDALEYIEGHYMEEHISLNAVAAATEVSPNYFSAMFSQKMNMTFVEYVTGKRMDRAKQLLRTTELPTAQIAAQVGYKDPHYFSFVFKKTQKCTPREYRSLSRRPGAGAF